MIFFVLVLPLVSPAQDCVASLVVLAIGGLLVALGRGDRRPGPRWERAMRRAITRLAMLVTVLASPAVGADPQPPAVRKGSLRSGPAAR